MTPEKTSMHACRYHCAPRSSVPSSLIRRLVINVCISGTQTILSRAHRLQKEGKTSEALPKGERIKSNLIVERHFPRRTHIDDFRFSHIFDGARLNTETAAFQLCDIHDEMLKQMIESASEQDLRDECDVCGFVLFPWFRALHPFDKGDRWMVHLSSDRKDQGCPSPQVLPASSRACSDGGRV